MNQIKKFQLRCVSYDFVGVGDSAVSRANSTANEYGMNIINETGYSHEECEQYRAVVPGLHTLQVQ